MTRYDNFRLSALAQFGYSPAAESRDDQPTALCIGCVSPVAVEAALGAAQAANSMAILVASRNQIESPEVGRGYAAPFAQRPLLEFIAETVRARVITVPVLVCRDHGGPWQRYDERSSGASPEGAIARARRSLADDVRAGIRYLHVDMSAARSHLTARELVATTVDLIHECEEVRSASALPVVAYEVSTEHADGGVSTVADMNAFLAPLLDILQQRDLPHPATVVVRCGTVCRDRRNTGHFNNEAAAQLAEHVHTKYNMRVKEHNGDYMNARELREHVPAGVDLINIGPSIGDAETTYLLGLTAREVARVPADRQSHFRQTLLAAIQRTAPTHIWHQSAFPSDDALLASCGHYVFSEPSVARSRELLFANCVRAHLVTDPHAELVRQVQGAISAIQSLLEPEY